jgi:hypothetical protein
VNTVIVEPGVVPLEVPVLLIAFNRPGLLSGLINQLRTVRPTRVYLAVDGPRADRPAEAALVAQCIGLAAEIDWDCEVRTRFQSRNLGCGVGASTAISWFFENEEQGIILEDDIRPNVDFFGFCAELLNRYADDTRVFSITGCNYVPREHIDTEGDYRFSRLPHVWGWATWRRSWVQHDLDATNWRSRLSLHDLWMGGGRSAMGTAYWANLFRRVARKEIDTWACQWALAAMASGQLTATPNTNLVENLGFNEEATHTWVTPSGFPPASGMHLPTQPCSVVPDARADEWTRVHQYQATVTGIAGKVMRRVPDRLRMIAGRRVIQPVGMTAVQDPQVEVGNAVDARSAAL